MVWIPYWGNNDEAGAPHDLFEKFYRAKLSDGSTAVCGGYICNEKYEKLYDYVDVPTEKPVKNEETGEDEIIIENVTELKEIGEVLVDFDFCEEEYNKYIEMQPSRVPDVVVNLIATADNESNAKINAGTIPNSAMAVNTFLSIDGEEINETPNFSYNEGNREALQSAVLAVTNGAPSARVNFDGMRPVKMTREAVLRLYLEMEQFARQEQAYALAFKAMVSAHKDDDKHQANYLESHYKYGMELEPKYQTMYENEMNDAMEELMAMNAHWGLAE